MATQRHKFLFECWKTLTSERSFLVSNCFMMNLKLQKCSIKTFSLCWVLRSKTAVMHCVTFSNVLYVFRSFMNNRLGHVYISPWVSRFALVTEIKICWEAISLRETIYKFQASCFNELSFFPTSWSAMFSQVWRRSIFKFCV